MIVFLSISGNNNLLIQYITCIQYTGITTLCVAVILLRSYCNKRWSKTRAKRGYQPINGNVDVKDYESINGRTDATKINHNIITQSSNMDNCKDYQSIRQSLL